MKCIYFLTLENTGVFILQCLGIKTIVSGFIHRKLSCILLKEAKMAETQIQKESKKDEISGEIKDSRNEDLFCRKCTRYFASRAEFNKHIKEHINETSDNNQSFMRYIENYTCSCCGKAFEVKSDLIIHYNTVCFDGPYTCKHCRENCETSPFLQMHLLFHHKYSEEMLRDEGFFIDLDNNPFISESSFIKSNRRKAFKSHPPEVEFCNVGNSKTVKASCSYRKSRRSKRKHENLAFNSLDKAHSCEICNESFSRKCVLDIHIQKHFLNETQEQVRDVSPNYSLMKQCENNLKSAVNAPHKRKIAGTSVGTESHIEGHHHQRAILKPSNVVLGSSAWKEVKLKTRFKRVKTCISTKHASHTNKNMYICDAAMQQSVSPKAVSRSSVDFQMPAWKKNKLSRRLRKAEISNKQKDLENVNKKKKSSSGSAEKHEKTMKNEKDQIFTCELCKGRFKDNYKLKRHLLIHSGERPFACTKCKKTFVRDDHLKRHIKKVCSKAE